MKKLLVSDIDGTLFKIGNQLSAGLSDENKRAIDTWRNEGNLIAIATGRTLDNVAAIESTLGFEVDYIGSNGSQIKFQEGAVMEHRIAMDFYRKLDEYLLRHEVDGIVSASMGNRKFYFSNQMAYPWNSNQPIAMDRYVLKEGLDTSIHAYDTNEEAVKMMLLIHPNQMEAVKLDLRMMFGEVLEIVSSDHDNIDVVRKGCSKGMGVITLANHLGISMDQVYTIGDSENDISMFQIGATGYAMSHSAGVVQQHVQHVVDAVCDAIGHIMEQ